MQMNMVVDRGKNGTDRVVDAIRSLPPDRLRLRRKSRVERLKGVFQSLPPVARVGVAAAATAGLLVGAAFVARRRLFVAAAVVAEVIEEAADTVEDAAEDLAEAARERAEAPQDGTG